jgi:hypothetical protein
MVGVSGAEPRVFAREGAAQQDAQVNSVGQAPMSLSAVAAAATRQADQMDGKAVRAEGRASAEGGTSGTEHSVAPGASGRRGAGRAAEKDKETASAP